MDFYMSNTNADDKLIGFEYQFFYFLLSLLRMRIGDTVGFEVEEDVHIQNDNQLLLCQLKHSTQKTTNNKKIKNLTTGDSDLWKTLSLWIDKIKELENNDELDSMYFLFVSNKSDNQGNDFLTNFRSFKASQNISNFKHYLNTYKDELEEKYRSKIIQKPETIKDKKIDYLKNILSIDDERLELFFHNMGFKLGLDNIIEKIKKVLKEEKYIASDFRIDRTFESLIGLLKEDFYKKVKEKESVQYTSEEFSNISKPIFKKMRNENLIFIQELENFERNISILDRIFAKQLKDIGIEDDEIYDYDYKRELVLTNLKELEQNNEISKEDMELLDKNTISNWKPIFEEIYLDEEYTERMAKKIFIKCKQLNLSLLGSEVPIRDISNGQFIKMSDIPNIGWTYNWKEEYKKDDD